MRRVGAAPDGTNTPFVAAGSDYQRRRARERGLWVGGPLGVAVGELHASGPPQGLAVLEEAAGLLEGVGSADSDRIEAGVQRDPAYLVRQSTGRRHVRSQPCEPRPLHEGGCGTRPGLGSPSSPARSGISTRGRQDEPGVIRGDLEHRRTSYQFVPPSAQASIHLPGDKRCDLTRGPAGGVAAGPGRIGPAAGGRAPRPRR